MVLLPSPDVVQASSTLTQPGIAYLQSWHLPNSSTNQGMLQTSRGELSKSLYYAHSKTQISYTLTSTRSLLNIIWAFVCCPTSFFICWQMLWPGPPWTQFFKCTWRNGSLGQFGLLSTHGFYVSEFHDHAWLGLLPLPDVIQISGYYYV